MRKLTLRKFEALPLGGIFMSGTALFPHPFAGEKLEAVQLVQDTLTYAKWVAVRTTGGKWEVRTSLSTKICKVPNLDTEEHIFTDAPVIAKKGRKVLDVGKIKELTGASQEVMALYDAV